MWGSIYCIRILILIRICIYTVMYSVQCILYMCVSVFM